MSGTNNGASGPKCAFCHQGNAVVELIHCDTCNNCYHPRCGETVADHLAQNFGPICNNCSLPTGRPTLVHLGPQDNTNAPYASLATIATTGQQVNQQPDIQAEPVLPTQRSAQGDQQVPGPCIPCAGRRACDMVRPICGPCSREGEGAGTYRGCRYLEPAPNQQQANNTQTCLWCEMNGLDCDGVRPTCGPCQTNLGQYVGCDYPT